uniref:Iron-sulfur cluster assembly scaffold protein n=1 Tax=Schlesneria paludicola TaxID=360056 RepID=A0A7C4LNJ1_9PLAN
MGSLDRLLDRDRALRWRGPLGAPSHCGYCRNCLCGDEVWVEVVVEQDVVRQIRFQGHGCMVSQACVSMLCEGVEGKSVADVLKATPEELMEFEFRELTMNRQRCALVGYEALMHALNDLRGPNTTDPENGRAGDVSA